MFLRIPCIRDIASGCDPWWWWYREECQSLVLTFCLPYHFLGKVTGQMQNDLFKNLDWLYKEIELSGGGSSFFSSASPSFRPTWRSCLLTTYIQEALKGRTKTHSFFWIQGLIAYLVGGRELKHFPIWSVWWGSPPLRLTQARAKGSKNPKIAKLLVLNLNMNERWKPQQI